MKLFAWMAAALLAAVLPAAALAQVEELDRREGYYYPRVGSEERFTRTLGNTPPGNRAIRTNFVTEITKAQLAAPESPRISIFAKGARAQHMIIIALDDEIFRTLYRARAQPAQLTANARGTDFFRASNLQFLRNPKHDHVALRALLLT